MKIDDEATNYMDEDPAVLLLREEGTYWEPPANIKAITKLKNWAWEGATHPIEDSLKKIKTIKSVAFAKKIKTVEPVTPTKNIVSVPIESIFDSISDIVKSIESIENSFPFNMISNSTYLLALNVFIYEIGKETLNNEELKHGHLEPIKEET